MRAVAAACLGTALALTALLFGSASLWVPAVALIGLPLGAAAWVALAAHGVGIERSPGPRAIEEGRPYPLRLALRPGILPPPRAELHEPLLAEPIRLSGATGGRVRIDVRFERRGKRVLEPGSLRMADPLGLVVREVAGAGEPIALLVLPRVDELEAVGRGSGAGGSDEGPESGGGRAALSGRLDGSAAELDLDGLRPYRLGTPASRIHWPAVARSGEMLERRLTADADSAPLVVLDASRPPSPEALDQAVRAATSLCVHLGSRYGCALLLPGDRRPSSLARDLGTWPALHARLALVEASATRPPLARVRRPGAVIWVSARADAPRDLARAAGAGSWLVTPIGEAGTAPSFTVAGCAGRRVGAGTRSRSAA